MEIDVITNVRQAEGLSIRFSAPCESKRKTSSQDKRIRTLRKQHGASSNSIPIKFLAQLTRTPRQEDEDLFGIVNNFYMIMYNRIDGAETAAKCREARVS